MFGQLAIITILFVGFGVYFFTLRPLLSVEPSGVADPLEITASSASEALGRFAFAEREQAGTGGDLEADPVLRDIKAHNPQFRYFVRVQGKEFRSGEGTPFFISLAFDRLQRQNLTAAYPGLCLNSTINDPGGPGRSFLAYADCGGQASYYEYAGIEYATASAATGSVRLYGKFIWSYGGIFLFTVAAAFVVFAVILLANVLRIRRVAALARDLDPDNLGELFPEKGLPLEVAPLVSALNQMILRVDEAQRRQRFFLSAAAHEMRTPLTVLRTRLEIMDDGRLKEKLISDVRRLTDLANQLLKLMTIGEAPAPLKATDLVTLTGRAVGEREVVARRRGLDLVFEREVTRYDLWADPSLVETAIGNVIDNALSFSAEGQRVVVRLDKDGWVRVRDQGPGIPSEQIKTLFEPFTRFSTGRAGYGLGLAIVKAVVDRHEGAVKIGEGLDGGAEVALRFDPDISSRP
ncbi:sensor histidine kinase [Brevundimonas intermedia]|nr:HAMP domain-containing sensor histidine kinase [Brevundimonas intermedia]